MVERLSRAVGLLGGGALSLYAARLYGRKRSDSAALAAALAGVGLVVQAILSSERRARLFGFLRSEGEALSDRAKQAKSGTLKVCASATIERPAEDLYKFWRDFSNLPQIMSHLESVEIDEDGSSKWTAKGPGRMHVVWRARVTSDKPNEVIAWRSLEGGDISNAGTVSFRPATGGRGTEVAVEMTYEPPGGRLGAWFAKTLGEAPEHQVQDDLRRFKQLMEAGEVATITGQPSGAR